MLNEKASRLHFVAFMFTCSTSNQSELSIAIVHAVTAKWLQVVCIFLILYGALQVLWGYIRLLQRLLTKPFR